jgi:hypothetical protein
MQFCDLLDRFCPFASALRFCTVHVLHYRMSLTLEINKSEVSAEITELKACSDMYLLNRSIQVHSVNNLSAYISNL